MNNIYPAIAEKLIEENPKFQKYFKEMRDYIVSETIKLTKKKDIYKDFEVIVRPQIIIKQKNL